MQDQLPSQVEAHGRRFSVRPLAGEAEARACAHIMSTTDPWITLGRPFEVLLERIQDPQREVWVAVDDGGTVAGFLILCMQGALVGYIQALAVHEPCRSLGLGSALVRWAEERIHLVSPNVFLCVSSFNPRAQALYTRLGFEVVGPLRDFLIRGADEILMRKTTGPLREFRAL